MAKRRRKKLTKGKARRIGKRRVFNRAAGKKGFACKRNGKRAMRVARRKSARRRKRGNGSTNYSNMGNNKPFGWAVILISFFSAIYQYLDYRINYVYESLDYAIIYIIILIVAICIKYINYKKINICEIEENEVEIDVVDEEIQEEIEVALAEECDIEDK